MSSDLIKPLVRSSGAFSYSLGVNKSSRTPDNYVDGYLTLILPCTFGTRLSDITQSKSAEQTDALYAKNDEITAHIVKTLNDKGIQAAASGAEGANNAMARVKVELSKADTYEGRLTIRINLKSDTHDQAQDQMLAIHKALEITSPHESHGTNPSNWEALTTDLKATRIDFTKTSCGIASLPRQSNEREGHICRMT